MEKLNILKQKSCYPQCLCQKATVILFSYRLFCSPTSYWTHMLTCRQKAVTHPSQDFSVKMSREPRGRFLVRLCPASELKLLLFEGKKRAGGARGKGGQGEGCLTRGQEANRRLKTRPNSFCWPWSWLMSAGGHRQGRDCYRSTI